MCWNSSVSGFFALFQYITALVVLKYSTNHRSTAYAVVLFCYGTMELLQFFTWQVIEPFSSLLAEQLNCSAKNKLLTTLSYVHIWFQPIVFTLFAYDPLQYHTTRYLSEKDTKRKNLFTIPILIAIVTFSAALLALVVGHTTDTQHQPTNMLLHHRASESCAFIGPNGYILWKFAYSGYDSLPFAFPNWFMYAALALVLLFVRPWYVMLFSNLCFWGFGLLAKMIMHWSLESSAFWCLTSISTAVLIIVEPIIETFVLETHEKSK